jgi:hypothetical protein
LERRIANGVTYLFHPLLIPTYGMGLIYKIYTTIYFINDVRVLLFLLGITFVSTCILPALSTIVMLRSGIIKDLEMKERKDRFLPYMITAMYYFFAFYLLKDFPIPSGMLFAVRIFVLGGAGAILLTALINMFWKISAHMVAQGGICACVLSSCLLLPAASVQLLYLCIFLAGVVAWARLKLEAHSPAQVYTGFGLGFLSILVMFLLF